MERTAYLAAIAAIFKDILGIMVQKSNGYAHEEDGFSNFNMAASFAGTDTETGIRIRIGDKISRLTNIFLGNTSDTPDETIEDNIRDLIGYLAILLLWRRLNHSTAGAAPAEPGSAEETKTVEAEQKSWFRTFLKQQ